MREIYEIIAVNGHYEVYQGGTEFLFSGDSYSECEHDLNEYLSENAA